MKSSTCMGIVLVALLAAACGSSSQPASSSSSAADAAPPDDPFAAQPDESAGLTNVGSDLGAVLEHGQLTGACDKYRGGQTDRTTMLLCGKWMFFYETFGTSGVPASLVSFLATNFPDELGLGFSKLGLVPDPASTDGLPLGMAPGVPLGMGIPSVAFTCASCHFAQLADGRYAMGAPNLHYDYARHILTISLAPGLAIGIDSPANHDPAAVAEVQPVLDRVAADPSLKQQLLSTLLPLASLSLPSMTTQIEHEYSTWPTGALDFLIAPLPVDDHVHVVGKMIGLWGVPRPAEVAAAGMSNAGTPSALLGWTGDTHGLDEFLRGFAVLGGATTTPTEDQMTPLMEYVYSLRAPSNPRPPEPSLVETGKALFTNKGCIGCHGGPRGAGKRAYALDEVGTDPAVARWANPSLGTQACCGVPTPAGGLTRGIKAPRLVGMWTLDRLLHDGTLSSLQQLFCMNGGRPAVGVEPLRADGHAFTCDALSDAEKNALIAYLLAH